MFITVPVLYLAIHRDDLTNIRQSGIAEKMGGGIL